MKLRKIYGLLLVVAAAIVIGCGGGGGGGSTTSSTSTSSTNGGSTGLDTGVYGTVLDSVGNPLSNLTVKFYTKGGSLVGTFATNAKGKFSAELPTNAKAFTIDLSTLVDGGNYFNQFGYNSLDFLANDTGCLASAPSFSTHQAVSLGTAIVLTPRWLGPPNPPTGCIGG